MKKPSQRILWLAIGAATVALALFFLLKPPAPGGEYGVNLLKNGDFEEITGEGLPAYWLPEAYNRVYGVSRFEVAEGFEGQGVLIHNLERNDARYAQTVTVAPNTVYQLTGRIKADVLDGRGANLSIADVHVVNESLLNTGDHWQQITVYGRTAGDQRELTVWVRVGGYSADSAGMAWFDDVSLMAVESAPAGVPVDNWSVWQAPQEKSAGKGSPAWPLLVLVAIAYGLVGLWLARKLEAYDVPDLNPIEGKHPWPLAFWGLLFAAAISRLLMAWFIPGYGVDIGCFTAWADRMYSVGPVDFYLTEAHSDYPPGYMLALWPLGALGSAAGTGATEMLVKLPAILADLLSIVVLYWFAAKRMRPKAALLLTALYALNPLTYAAGAAWGQVDSIPAFLLVVVILLAFESKWSLALPVYVLAALMKPQALMFGPLGLAALVVDLRMRPEKGNWTSVLFGIGASLVVAAAVVLPFSPRQQGWDWLVQLYGGTMSYYAYATVNATNLFFLFGLNWQPITAQAPVLMRLLGAATLIIPALAYVAPRWKQADERGELIALSLSLLPAIAGIALPVSLGTLGTLLMVSGFLLVAIRYVVQKDIQNLPLLGAVMLIVFCVLGAMMHERYLFPAALLLILAYVIRRDRRIFWLLMAVSLLAFLNTGIVLDRAVRIGGVEGHLEAPLFGIVSESGWLEYLLSALQVAFAMGALYIGLQLSRPDAETLAFLPPIGGQKTEGQFIPRENAATTRLLNPIAPVGLRTKDWLIMLGITGLYAVLALSNLGSAYSPENPWIAQESEETIVFDLGQSRPFKVLYYGGLNWRESDFEIAASDDMENWLPHEAKLKDGDLFSWQYQTHLNPAGSSSKFSSQHVEHQGRYVRIRSNMIGTSIMEMQFRDPGTGQRIHATLVTGNGHALIDEQDTLKGEPSWYDGMYFDEIYHARTAYEHLNAIRGVEPNATYEVSHPPLGKVLMSFSIMMFGMNPFGWRFAGAVAGVLMLPGLYLMGLLLTRKRLFAAGAMLLMAFDTMHFTQTRIATIDSFVTLFIIWSYYFMFRYALADDYNRPFRRTLWNLALSGLFMGLGVASKWTGIYAGLGLAVIFFWVQWRRVGEGLAAEELIHSGVSIDAQRARAVTTAAREWRQRLAYTLLLCLLFFVAVPAGIYYLSFLPWFMRTPGGLTIKKVVDASVSMYNYHSGAGLGMDHGFYSPWYQWPIIYKPMWFYSSRVVDGAGSSIITFGNPAVWWGGLMGLLATLWAATAGRSATRSNDLTQHSDNPGPVLLLISFAVQYLPWVLVPRGTYIYHYFPSVPFIILCTMWVLGRLYTRRPRLVKATTWVYLALAGALFIAFFPYASGIRVPVWWLESMRWFPNWLYY